MNIVTFILIVYTHVNGGSVVSFQEFNSQKSCEYAKSLLDHKYGMEAIYCMEK
jgi:hypothetical protein